MQKNLHNKHHPYENMPEMNRLDFGADPAQDLDQRSIFHFCNNVRCDIFAII